MLHIARLADLQHELLTLLQPMLRLMRRWQSPLTEQLGRQHAAGGSLCKAWCTAEGWVHIQPAHHQCTFKRSKAATKRQPHAEPHKLRSGAAQGHDESYLQTELRLCWSSIATGMAASFHDFTEPLQEELELLRSK